MGRNREDLDILLLPPDEADPNKLKYKYVPQLRQYADRVKFQKELRDISFDGLPIHDEFVTRLPKDSLMEDKLEKLRKVLENIPVEQNWKPPLDPMRDLAPINPTRWPGDELLYSEVKRLSAALNAQAITETAWFKVVEELFPHAAEEGTDYRPIPWLTIEGGMKLWGTKVTYLRTPETLMLQTEVHVPGNPKYPPCCEAHRLEAERDGMPLIGRRTFFFRRHWYGKNREQIVDSVMQAVREVFVHEVLEGLLVNGKIHFYEEVEKLHR